MFTATPRVLLYFAFAALGTAAGLDREIVLTPHRGGAPEDRAIVRSQVRAQTADARAADFERLGWAYVAKARRTLDAGFYKLAEKTADVIDAEFGASADSRLLRAHVLHNLHRFGEAETIARQLVAERGAPTDLALLSDTLIEQGKLSEGIAALQRMVNAKPGTEAYSRIAHVRWLKGDLAGATAAMETALAASRPDDAETRAWLLTRLSGFALQSGEPESALRLAEAAADRLADFPAALLAGGRALVSLGRTADAIARLERAAELQPLPEYQWWLADALRLTGRTSDAVAVEERLQRRGAEEDPRTLALFLAARGEEPARAVRLARAELSQRADVFSHDALAWALLAAGDSEGAGVAIQAAMAAGTRDARLAWHAGEIALARGDSDSARGHFAAARPMAGTLTPAERARLERRIATETGFVAR